MRKRSKSRSKSRKKKNDGILNYFNAPEGLNYEGFRNTWNRGNLQQVIAQMKAKQEEINLLKYVIKTFEKKDATTLLREAVADYDKLQGKRKEYEKKLGGEPLSAIIGMNRNVAAGLADTTTNKKATVRKTTSPRRLRRIPAENNNYPGLI